MKISFENTHVPHDFRVHAMESLIPYIQELSRVVEEGGYESEEASLNLLTDETLSTRLHTLAESKSRNVQLLLVIGIGGSNLGTRAIFEALRGSRVEGTPTLIFLESTFEEDLLKARHLIEDLNSADEILVCTISKSGRTTETIANTEIIFTFLKEKFGEGSAIDRFLVITDSGSPFEVRAAELGISTIEIPKNVGGRFSVFSAVGLFPLTVLGCNTDTLLKGALEMREECLTLDESNPALSSALFLAYHSQNGRNIHDMFSFDPHFEYVGLWYRQLLAESIGKKDSREGNEVHTGITPTVSLGSRDLHSVGQLTIGGPRDKMTTFISNKIPQEDLRMDENGPFSGLVKEIAHKTPAEILEALSEGAKKAYTKEDLPFVDVVFEASTRNEAEIGKFLQWKMLEIMLLAHLLNINAFDQPSVESYKILTREILELND